MRVVLLILLCALIATSGCATDVKRGTLEEEFANMSEDERIRMCTNFYRDAKASCREGLQNESASQSYECLSARMQIERFCLSPK